MSHRIWATIGPASFSREVVREMESLGVGLFRINLSHTPLSAVAEWIARIGEWTDVPICLDSEGAQMRNETMAGDAVAYAAGDTVKVHFEPVKGDRANISFSPRGIARQFAVGDRIRVDFDHLCLGITATADDGWMARVEVGGEVGSNKAADLERPISMPAITEKDRAAIAIGRDMGIRHFALSFASNKEDILEMREIAGPGATIVSKVESP